MSYKSFTHVERINSSDCDGLLNNQGVVISAKVDGSNSCVWSDIIGNIHTGSRTREINVDSDNAGFAAWAISDNPEATKLRSFCRTHPDMIVYGEWMGSKKFVGQIKDYSPYALGHMWIFDVYDLNTNRYLGDHEWRDLLKGFDLEQWFVAILAELDYPTVEDIEKVARDNHFLLEQANHPGEGVICKVKDWTNAYGHFCYGKLVLDEYIQQKKVKKKAPTVPGELEQNIVNYYVTDAEITKCAAKLCNTLEVDRLDPHKGQHVGRFLNNLYHDTILECVVDWTKRFKVSVIDFSILKNLTYVKGREYLGL